MRLNVSQTYRCSTKHTNLSFYKQSIYQRLHVALAKREKSSRVFFSNKPKKASTYTDMVNIQRSLKCIRARKYANERNTIYLCIRERHMCHHATQARLVSTQRTSMYVYTTAWNLFVHNIVRDKYPCLYVYIASQYQWKN